MTSVSPRRRHGRSFRCVVPSDEIRSVCSMSFVVVSIYLAAVVFCVGTTAWILRAWTRRRYWHKSPSDLHYVVAGTALLLSAGIGGAGASQIVVAPRFPPAPLTASRCFVASRGRFPWPVNPRRPSSAFNFCSLLKSVALDPRIATRHGLVGLTSTGASSSKR